MRKSLPVFRPSGQPLDLSDKELDDMAAEIGAPRFETPSKPPAPLKEQTPPVEIAKPPQSITPPIAVTPPAPMTPASAHIPPIDYAQPKKPKRSGVKSDVWLPDYLHEAVRIQSIKSKISLRTYCIMGLQAIGFEVRPEDLIPDHRRKPRQ